MSRETYARGFEVTLNVVRGWRGGTPKFRFPPRDIPLIADLREVGRQLVANPAAVAMLTMLIDRCMEETGEAPTAMMLRVALEAEGHAIEFVPLRELGLVVGGSCLRCGAAAGEPCNRAKHDAHGETN